MKAQLSANSADQVAQFVCEVTVDTQAPSLDSDTFFTTMDDYIPGRNLLVHSSAAPDSLRKNGNFITDFHAPTREEIPAYWQRYLPVPLCFHMFHANPRSTRESIAASTAFLRKTAQNYPPTAR